MPATISDLIRGRARVQDLTSSVQADVRYQGVIGAVTSRIQGIANQVRSRTGVGTRTQSAGGAGGVMDNIRSRLNGVRGGAATQRVGASQSPGGEEYGSIR
jgi:hypothetical protein